MAQSSLSWLFRDTCPIFVFSSGLLALGKLFALVLYFRYPRVYQTLLEYIGTCYHLVYTTINSVWGLVSHLLYLISYSLASITCLHRTHQDWRFLSGQSCD